MTNKKKLNGILERATALAVARRWAEAAKVYAEAIALGATDYSTHYNYGTVLLHCGLFEEGRDQMRAALRYNPSSLEALNNLAASSLKLGNAGATEKASRRIVAIDPRHHVAWTNLGMALCDQGKVEEGLVHLRKALALAPGYQIARESLLLALNHLATDGAAHLAEHLSRCAVFTPVARKPLPDTRGRRIRLGYVSSDFRNHSVAFFMKAVIGSHDREAFEVTCYSSTHAPDLVTRQFAGTAEHFVDIATMADSEFAKQVEADGIDILVDLGGHTSGNRLGAFALRPAPVQVNYLGYPSTTGCAFIDYRLVDEITDPSESDAYASETLIRLPAPFLCYDPIHPFPALTPPPLLASGSITFGSFNNSSKISPATVKLWSLALKAVPGSRLFVKARAFSDAEVCESFRQRFIAQGIDGSRLTFSGLISDPIEHLAAYARLDIALDTFPYNGTTTTCEALWMGVPVVSLTGQLHAARVGKSLLTAVGLTHLACASEDAFVAAVQALAGDPAELGILRQRLRGTMTRSPLCDRKRLLEALEQAYRSMLFLEGTRP
ncbi:MAG TPA: hypothetical protein VJ486_01950 [Geothrix sp.]|nr:hypothetical protein [Geothrix sp.]